MKSQKIIPTNKTGSSILTKFQSKLNSKKSMPRHKKSFYVFYIVVAIVIVVLSVGL